MDKDELARGLRTEGFGHTYVWQDARRTPITPITSILAKRTSFSTAR
jgi:hypothetical protein